MDSLKLGPVRYCYTEVDSLQKEDGSPLFGEIDYAACTIRLWAGAPPQRKLVTRWHEVLHVLLMQSGHPKERNDESLVTALAYGIVQVLRDNPGMHK